MAISSLAGLILLSNNSFGVDYKTRYVKHIYHYPQEKVWWCTYATTQMWIKHLTGKKIPQWRIGLYMFHSSFSTQNGGKYVGLDYNHKTTYSELYNRHWKPSGAQNRFATDD